MRFAIAASILLFSCYAEALASEPPDQLDGEFEAICEAYQANRQSFLFGTFHFEYARGKANNDAEALAGRFSKGATAQGVYVFNGSDWRYEVNFKLEDVARFTTRINDRQKKSSLLSYRILCDGRVTFLDLQPLSPAGGALASRPKIVADVTPFTQRFTFPLSIGLDEDPNGLDLYTDLKRVKDKALRIKEMDAHSGLGGLDACKIVLEGANNYRRTYWVDLDRGATPLRIEDSVDTKSDGNQTSFLVQSDLVFLGNGGWLPRILRFSMQTGKVAKEVHITDADVITKPGDSSFTLEYPDGVPVYDVPKALMYSARSSWSLHHLPGRNSREASFAPVRAYVPPPEMPSEAAGGLPWLTVLLIGLSVVVFALVLVRVTKKSWWHLTEKTVGGAG